MNINPDIIFISNEILEKNKTGVDLWSDINQELIEDDIMNNYLGNYLVLTLYPEKFSNESPLMIYYNRYYWFSKFYNRYSKLHTDDLLNIRQQEFKIIEVGERFPDIDWTLMEQISMKSRTSEE